MVSITAIYAIGLRATRQVIIILAEQISYEGAGGKLKHQLIQSKI